MDRCDFRYRGSGACGCGETSPGLEHAHRSMRINGSPQLAIVTGTQHAYTLPSGVHVVPLAVLGV